MAREKKEKKRRGRHAEGAGPLEQELVGIPEARPPELAGRQVFPPQAQQQYAPAEGQPIQQEPAVPVQPIQQPQQGVPFQPVRQPPSPQPPSAFPQPVPPLQQPPPQVQQQVAPAAPTAQPVPHAPPTVEPLQQEPGPPELTEPASPEPGAPTPQVVDSPAPMPEAQPPAPQPGTQGMYPPGMAPAPGYIMPPPWYPPYGVPSPYFGFPPPGQTGQIPVVPGALPPGAPRPQAPMPGEGPQMMPPGVYPPLGMQPMGMPPMGVFPPGEVAPPMAFASLEEPEFESLTVAETSHWRGDFKWIFGIITALLIFLALGSAGLYRATSAGSARQVLVPMVGTATQVKQFVKDNYQELRSKARRSSGANIYIPDIGVTISIKGDVISSLSAEDLAERVILEVERQIYAQGYKQSLKMTSAQGAGEERAKATVVTILSKMNKATHNALLWPMVIFGVLALAFGILFIVFCRGWGKVVGAGIVFIMGSLAGSLSLRIGHQFIWRVGASGTFKPAANQALRTISSLAVAYYDIVLAFGGLVLLVGVVGAVIVRKSRERVQPFTELKSPDKAVVGGPAVEPGMTPDTRLEQQPLPQDNDSFFLKDE